MRPAVGLFAFVHPYEILTYLFDSYYVLPERPDLAALFCWQAINHSYYVQQLSDNNVGFCQDTKGIELIRSFSRFCSRYLK